MNREFLGGDDQTECSMANPERTNERGPECVLGSRERDWPVTTKAQQKAENADNADNAKVKSAILLGFCESSEKPSKTKGVRVTPSAPRIKSPQ